MEVLHKNVNRWKNWYFVLWSLTAIKGYLQYLNVSQRNFHETRYMFPEYYEIPLDGFSMAQKTNVSMLFGPPCMYSTLHWRNALFLFPTTTPQQEMQLFPQNPLPAPHRPTGLQIITGNYRLTTAHYRQITGIYMTFTIKDIYRYRRFTDNARLFTADYHR